MDDDKRGMKGSDSRDRFKRAHKDLPGWMYGCDIDFCLVSKKPPGVVAYVDYKNGSDDYITFSEVIAYNRHITIAPLYIIRGRDPDKGPFDIQRYLRRGDFHPEPPLVYLSKPLRCNSWDRLKSWEQWLRREYERRKGWGDNVPIFDWETPERDEAA